MQSPAKSHWRMSIAFGPNCVVAAVVLVFVCQSGLVFGGESPVRDELRDSGIDVTPVSLTEAVSAARQSAPNVVEAEARLKKGWARRRRADVFLPYNPSLTGEIERFDLGGFSYGEFRVGVEQRFPLGGERKAEKGAADTYAKLQKLRLSRARWRAETQVRRVYFASRIRIRRYRFAIRVRDFSRRLLTATEQRFEGGQISKIEVATARSRHARARQRVIEERAKLKKKLQNLATLIDHSGSSLPWASDSLPTLRDISTSRESDIQRRARRSAPTVEVREAQIRLASRDLQTAKRRAWPDPKVGVFFKNRSPEFGGSVNGLVGGLSVPLPVWERDQGDRSDAKADRVVAHSRLASFRRELDADIAQTVTDLRAARQKVRVFRAATEPALESRLSLLEQGFNAGEFDVTDVTVAERRLVEQRLDALRAFHDYIRAMTRLERLTGIRLWPSTDGAAQ